MAFVRFFTSVPPGAPLISYAGRHTFTERVESGHMSAGAIRRDHVRAAIGDVFDGPGRTIREIERGKGRRAADPTQEALRDERVWHSRAEFLDPIAKKLRLHPSLWGGRRQSNDFYATVDQEISKLRRMKAISDWRPRSGIFRLSGSLPAGWADVADPRPTKPAPTADMSGAFMSILRKGAKANTYKFALARAMLDHCREKRHAGPDSAEARKIPYGYLAGKFLKYYWHQECKFHIKQNFKEDQEPSAISAIREVFGSKSPGDFAKLDPADIERAKSLILRDVFGHARKKTSLVVPKFQNIKRGGGAALSDVFYEYSDDEQMMVLRPEAFTFFRDNNGILSEVVLAGWTKFLEPINNLPMLMAKVERDDSRRGSLTGVRKEYLGHTCHCFYCGAKLERGSIDVDHVIPWSYMFEDDPWNLVLACTKCNCKKSDSLPQKEFLDLLIHRNLKYYDTVKRVKRSLDRLDSGRGWQPEIENHYHNCEEYGFAVQALP